ncbi:asparagine synthase (glutamine-hydrolyzing) [Desulfovibrio sp. JC010]|uniref:asparagine synthase (glutamine-hydrolyzing) n=1 Tax=Desulfovibrio sp. JC010 TaxID=2593641 RepID=UPI0013D5D5C5|nr:asparagine synthase (glutamine-hydrolyzing) [Desulfovibrio sp. JC010]NDV27478.1 asparagine synthase (glutamine-hydrolyzing) [Desulfovibrio sp. JC010]
MCGIAGIVSFDYVPDLELTVRRMTDSLAHRGPDASGLHVRETRGAWVGLGHRRLSIIDLSENANQPLGNETGDIQLVFNGEIYNYKSVRAELERAGHRFRTNTDSEVIVHGYEQWGDALLSHLDGMFAFAVWDGSNQRLFLARDRFGKKPLYWFRTSRGIAFSSEIKGLLKHPECPREIDRNSVCRYLLHEYVPAPYTLLENVFKVMPAHYASFDRSGYSETRYWDISFGSTIEYSKDREPEVARRVGELLQQATERRLISDVPLGLFLSGGVDSTAILSMMSDLPHTDRIRTFSIGFEESSFDESRFADMAANHFGSDHSSYILSSSDLGAVLDEIWDFMDDPIADGSLVPTYILSRFTSESVTVALSGEGGDELFAGYDPFVADIAADWYSRIPGFIRHGIQSVAKRLPVSRKNMSFDFRVKHFLKGMAYPEDVRHQIWLGSFSPAQQQALLSQETRDMLGDFDTTNELRCVLAQLGERDRVDRTTGFYCKFYMADCLLPKVDRASMATSLEVRSPFLDKDLAEYVNRLDSRYKLNGLKQKYILKRMLRGRVPTPILNRGKKGFGMPVAKLLRGELRPLLLERLSPENVRQGGLFDPDAVSGLVNSHLKGTQDNRKLLWTLIVFESWRKRLLEDSFQGPTIRRK